MDKARRDTTGVNMGQVVGRVNHGGSSGSCLRNRPPVGVPVGFLGIPTGCLPDSDSRLPGVGGNARLPIGWLGVEEQKAVVVGRDEPQVAKTPIAPSSNQRLSAQVLPHGWLVSKRRFSATRDDNGLKPGWIASFSLADTR